MAKKKCPINEMAAFGIGFGVILAILAYFALTGIEKSAPDLFGVQRNLGFGIPLLVLSAGFLVSGIWLKVAKSKAAVVMMVATGGLLLLGDLAIEVGLFGTLFAFRLVSIIIYALPIILAFKAGGVFKRIEEQERAERSAAARAYVEPAEAN